MLKKARLLTRPTLAVISPSHPESAKTASSPRDAPCPKQGHSGKPSNSSYLSIPLLRGAAKAALNCAHRTSTVSSCAFCEQGGHLAAPRPLFQHPASIDPSVPAGQTSDLDRDDEILPSKDFHPGVGREWPDRWDIRPCRQSSMMQL